MIEAEKDWLQKGKRAKGKIQANQVSTQSSALSNLEFGLYLWKVRFSIWKWDTFNIFYRNFFCKFGWHKNTIWKRTMEFDNKKTQFTCLYCPVCHKMFFPSANQKKQYLKFKKEEKRSVKAWVM